MFESVELGHQTCKDIYKQEAPKLRESLIATQQKLIEHKAFPVIILIGGVDGAGKGETANLLNQWMDARHIDTHAFGPPTPDEASKPSMWRFWQALPPKGEIGIFFGSWYTEPTIKRAYGTIKLPELDGVLNAIVRFERMLTDEGALIIKIWLHLSKEAQKLRIKTLQQDPKTAWRVNKQDVKHLKLYDKFRGIADHMLKETSTVNAPWFLVEGLDANYRNLTVGRYILDSIKSHIAVHAKHHAGIAHKSKKTRSNEVNSIALPSIDGVRILDTLNLNQVLEDNVYKEQLERLQGQLNLLTRHPKFNQLGLVITFEGVDAAGKGGSIRRITQAIDARKYKVIPIAAPDEQERAQPYLWRFWRNIPSKGRITIFDRSWYGRVLVERVEEFCSPEDWGRAYTEINNFEEQLSKSNVLLIKFWLQISQDEQLKRFEKRQEITFKNYKITQEDWRNRKKWDDYQQAACDMIERTSTEIAPWKLIEANDKNDARIKILRHICNVLEIKLSKL
jgi:polyphosphate:AMP phosphotransferase